MTTIAELLHLPSRHRPESLAARRTPATVTPLPQPGALTETDRAMAEIVTIGAGTHGACQECGSTNHVRTYPHASGRRRKCSDCRPLGTGEGPHGGAA